MPISWVSVNTFRGVFESAIGASNGDLGVLLALQSLGISVLKSGSLDGDGR